MACGVLGRLTMSPFLAGPRIHRLGILFLFLMLAVLALEAWGIRSGLENLF